MNIILHRISVNDEFTEGQLIIDGQVICDTLENSFSCRPVGLYRVHLHRCHQYARKMILLSAVNQPSAAIDLCLSCKPQEHIGINTVMPRFCPMIKPGNGILKRHDGSIIVGKRHCQGLLIHPKEVFNALYDRIRKALSRGETISLTIEDS